MRPLRAIVLITALLAAGAGPALADFAVFPEHPTSNDPVEIVFAVTCGCHLDFEPPQLAGSRILISGKTMDILAPPILGPYLRRFVVNPLPAGNYQVEIELDGKLTHGFSFTVFPTEPVLRFDDARLSVMVNWKNPREGTQGTAKPIALTPDSGYFHFFDWQNVELTVKLLDGRPVNGRWWLFLASMTTLEVEIVVTQCPPENLGIPCLTRTYVQPAGQNRNFVDTSTF